MFGIFSCLSATNLDSYIYILSFLNFRLFIGAAYSRRRTVQYKHLPGTEWIHLAVNLANFPGFLIGGSLESP